MEREELEIIGRTMARELYRLQHCDLISAEQAAHLLGCTVKTLYNRKIPHNRHGYSKKAVLEMLRT